jgi:hypothetical protein
MSDYDLICNDDVSRRQTVRRRSFNGLDYLEVSEDQRRLHVYFLDKAPKDLVAGNFRIDGGERITGIRVIGINFQCQADEDIDDCIELIVDKPGDYSIYTLCWVEADEMGHPTDRRPPEVDPRYQCLRFSFKEGCVIDMDCKPEPECPPDVLADPEISLLAKDYASFRQLILDRVALIMPDWQERHVPDIGIMLVETLAYVGDHLSYYQDAVATEAYLNTARQRISVRRHVRLVDYAMHDGCNARAWVCITVEGADHAELVPGETWFITGHNNALDLQQATLTPEQAQEIPTDQYEVFEPLLPGPDQMIRLFRDHNEIQFYTWGDQECCLPRGTTRATLIGKWVDRDAPETPPVTARALPSRKQAAAAKRAESQTPVEPTPPAAPELRLKVGDILIVEEVIGPRTGLAADADPQRRQAVRLTRVEPGIDPLYEQPIVEIEWAKEDALTFPLCLSAIGPAPECTLLENISVARGNVVLVDHGRRIDRPELLGTVSTLATVAICEGQDDPSDVLVVPGRFRPALSRGPVIFSEPLPEGTLPARDLLRQDPRQALPWIKLGTLTRDSDGISHWQEANWAPRHDLLDSAPDDRHFVAEIDNDERAHLRFGDGDLGFQPPAQSTWYTIYRMGRGTAGNVGAEAISHIVSTAGYTLTPRNPLPARGGTAPESIAEAKLNAPGGFRAELARAITPDDYVQLAERFPDGLRHGPDPRPVQRAAATLRWTGSWYEMWVAVDPFGQPTPAELDELLNAIKKYLHRYRRILHDVVVRPAHYVPLDIELCVTVLPSYFRGHVQEALLEVLSNRMLPDGRLGFFHPDNLTFGQGVYLSKLVAVVQAVPGVEAVEVLTFHRLFEEPNGEIESGILPLGPLEIARLDNDPNLEENGVLRLKMRGGR